MELSLVLTVHGFEEGPDHTGIAQITIQAFDTANQVEQWRQDYQLPIGESLTFADVETARDGDATDPNAPTRQNDIAAGNAVFDPVPSGPIDVPVTPPPA